MPNPYPLRLILNVLKRKGFFFVSQKGSHAKYRKDGNPTLTVIVPIHEKKFAMGHSVPFFVKQNYEKTILKKNRSFPYHPTTLLTTP